MQFQARKRERGQLAITNYYEYLQLKQFQALKRERGLVALGQERNPHMEQQLFQAL